METVTIEPTKCSSKSVGSSLHVFLDYFSRDISQSSLDKMILGDWHQLNFPNVTSGSLAMKPENTREAAVP